MTPSRTLPAILALGTGVLALACSGGGGDEPPGPSPEESRLVTASRPATFAGSPEIASPAFSQGDNIPARYTCEGEDLSPALSWSVAPAGVQSIALLVDDPDAPGGVFTHWFVLDLPPDTIGLAENASGDAPGVTGKNDFGSRGYRGPCPPAGPPHRYRFNVYYLETSLGLEPDSEREDFLDAAEGHVVAQAQITGTFGR